MWGGEQEVHPIKGWEGKKHKRMETHNYHAIETQRRKGAH